VKVAMITIGQSPRKDMIPEIKEILGDVEIVEIGCLDELTKEQINNLRPKGEEPVLVTLLRDGTSVKVSKEKMVDLLHQTIKKVESQGGVDIITILCTGDMPDFDSDKLIIEPGKLIHGVVRQILMKNKKLGVIIPSAEQVEQSKEKWGDIDTIVTYASPYGQLERIEKAARILKEKNVDLIILDCMGFTKDMKRKVQKITGKPVILARTLTARVLKELVEC